MATAIGLAIAVCIVAVILTVVHTKMINAQIDHMKGE